MQRPCPELDKATVLTPDNAGLHVSLGNAYINTGEKEKALAAFERGAELSQTPSVWNNIAYNLAEHQLELDKASAMPNLQPRQPLPICAMLNWLTSRSMT